MTVARYRNPDCTRGTLVGLVQPVNYANAGLNQSVTTDYVRGLVHNKVAEPYARRNQAG